MYANLLMSCVHSFWPKPKVCSQLSAFVADPVQPFCLFLVLVRLGMCLLFLFVSLRFFSSLRRGLLHPQQAIINRNPGLMAFCKGCHYWAQVPNNPPTSRDRRAC